MSIDQRFLVMIAFIGAVLIAGGTAQAWFALDTPGIIGMEFYFTGIDFATEEHFSILEYTYMPWIIIACGGTSAAIVLVSLVPSIRGKYRSAYIVPIVLSLAAIACSIVVMDYFNGTEMLAIFDNIVFDQNRGLWISIAGGIICAVGSVLCMVNKDPPRIKFI